jgi:hypothetical protein
MSRKPLLDPVDEAQRRDDLERLIGDVGRLPDQQRSALLMREIDGLSYADMAAALDVTVPAVKSLLVRARVGLVEAQESRDADCGEIRRDLMSSYDRGVKASGRARRHMRECAGCREYRQGLRGVRRSFAALTPAGAGPAALLAKLIGVGGAGGGAAAAGGGGGAAAMGGAATATACKVAAVVCATAITAGGAVEVTKLAKKPVPKREHIAPAHATKAAARAASASGAAAVLAHPGAAAVARTQAATSAPAAPAPQHAVGRHAPRAAADEPIVAPPPDPAPAPGNAETPVAVSGGPQVSSGGTAAPADSSEPTDPASEPADSPPADPASAGSDGAAGESPAAEPSPAPAPEPLMPGGTGEPLPQH